MSFFLGEGRLTFHHRVVSKAVRLKYLTKATEVVLVDCVCGVDLWLCLHLCFWIEVHTYRKHSHAQHPPTQNPITDSITDTGVAGAGAGAGAVAVAVAVAGGSGGAGTDAGAGTVAGASAGAGDQQQTRGDCCDPPADRHKPSHRATPHRDERGDERHGYMFWHGLLADYFEQGHRDPQRRYSHDIALQYGGMASAWRRGSSSSSSDAIACHAIATRS